MPPPCHLSPPSRLLSLFLSLPLSLDFSSKSSHSSSPPPMLEASCGELSSSSPFLFTSAFGMLLPTASSIGAMASCSRASEPDRLSCATEMLPFAYCRPSHPASLLRSPAAAACFTPRPAEPCSGVESPHLLEQLSSLSEELLLLRELCGAGRGKEPSELVGSVSWSPHPPAPPGSRARTLPWAVATDAASFWSSSSATAPPASARAPSSCSWRKALNFAWAPPFAQFLRCVSVECTLHERATCIPPQWKQHLQTAFMTL